MSQQYIKRDRIKLFMDIETLPLNETLRTEIGKQAENEIADGIIQDKETLQDLIEKRFRHLALSGEKGRILCIGMIYDNSKNTPASKLLGWADNKKCFHEDEVKILEQFWNICKKMDFSQDLIVGHNIFDFDLLFIYKRSIINKVKPSVNFPFARYRSQPIYDTMREWEKWRWERISLENLAETLEVPNPKNQIIDGSKVYDHFIAGNYQQIADYCIRDVITLRKIYNRMNFLQENGDIIRK